MDKKIGRNNDPAGETSTVTVDRFLAMSEEERQRLTQSKRKKLLKLVEVRKRKEAKAAAAKAKAASEPVKKDTEGAAKKGRKKREKVNSLPSKDFVNSTIPGEKKDMSAPMDRAYHPRAVEAAWYSWWERQGYFYVNPETALNASDDRKFTMVIPPPNVTGYLHIGHTLTNSIEDAITRFHRMHGKLALWLPGVDHAGIATQAAVEKQLMKGGLTRHDLGRENFVNEIWKWTHEKRERIKQQMERTGNSCDWSKENFTLSPKLSTAVREAFCRFYEKGLLYRATRLVNWCPALRTAISDIEVDRVDVLPGQSIKVPGYDTPVEFGMLTKFAYKLINDDGTVSDDDELVVATTRLETMLGDVAVAVHPHDERYKRFVGKSLQHPFVSRKLLVVADDVLVDMNFGTGAVKVTPAHDLNDFECGRRQKLPEINILTDDGRMASNCGEFAGQPRYLARVNIEQALRTKGLLRGKEGNAMSLGLCSRTGDVIEPLLKPQWWMNCKELAQQAVKKVETGELRIIPEDFKSTWYQWLNNIRDWCVSRQLWWGHRIPAYKAKLSTVEASQEANSQEVWVVARSEEEARERAAELLKISEDKAEHIALEQDEDVLDTWFSSGLFPFSVFGWPNISDVQYRAFYPTTLLETGHDILFFWVARMVMMGLGLTDRLPFRTVYLHSMVRDKKGRKMTKSLGNIIDPLDIIDGTSLSRLNERLRNSNLPGSEIELAVRENQREFPQGIPECGADALRMGLLAYTAQARDINLDIGRIVGYRNFCNKLWNATRFALMNLGENFKSTEEGVRAAVDGGDIANRWILSRLNNAVSVVNNCFRAYSMAEAVAAAYNFWLYELCGIYLENIKPIMRSSDEQKKSGCRHVLYICLNSGLRLLHPMMPFVTEELFQRLPNTGLGSICIAPYPVENPTWEYPEAAACMDATMAVVRMIRLVKSEYNLEPAVAPNVYVCGHDESSIVASYVETLSPCGNVSLVRDHSDIPGGCAIKLVGKAEVHVALQGLIDFKKEISKLEASLAEKKLLVEDYESKMTRPEYESRVPQDVRERDQELKEKYEGEVKSIKVLVDKFRSLQNNPDNDR